MTQKECEAADWSRVSHHKTLGPCEIIELHDDIFITPSAVVRLLETGELRQVFVEDLEEGEGR